MENDRESLTWSFADRSSVDIFFHCFCFIGEFHSFVVFLLDDRRRSFPFDFIGLVNTFSLFLLQPLLIFIFVVVFPRIARSFSYRLTMKSRWQEEKTNLQHWWSLFVCLYHRNREENRVHHRRILSNNSCVPILCQGVSPVSWSEHLQQHYLPEESVDDVPELPEQTPRLAVNTRSMTHFFVNG